MSLILIGTSHHTAPVELRERVAIAERDQPSLLRELRSNPEVSGAVVLSTCNRTEIIASVISSEISAELVEILARRSSLEPADLEKHLYLMQDAEVARHLFRVTAGLDSMIVGEPQITGQVHSAFELALEHGGPDGILRRLFENAFRVSKTVRTETGIGEMAVSVPFAAVELAKKIFGRLDHLHVMLAGAGEMGALTAEHLSSYRLRQLFVANRSGERARELSARLGGTAIDFEDLTSHLANTDIVITSTTAPHHFILKDHVVDALRNRPRRDLFLIDLAVPRNIDPDVAGVRGAYLYNIDDLERVVDKNLQQRVERARVAEEIVGRETDSFVRTLAGQDAVPTILELRSRLEEIREVELEKCLRKLGPISANQREAVEAMTRGIVNKILHYPIVRLKESAADQEPHASEMFRDTIRRIFNL
jgi:glutamyl-tRNA reductase